MRNWISVAVLAGLAALAALPAAATTSGIEIVITRLGDTEGSFTGSGSAGLMEGPYESLQFLDFTGPVGALIRQDGNFGLGNLQPIGGFFRIGDILSVPGAGFLFSDTDAPVGSGTYAGITLPGVGTSGDLIALPEGGGFGDEVTVGRWRVEAVPLPAAAWLLLGGLGALGPFARRRHG